jgi:hypothetical protein
MACSEERRELDALERWGNRVRPVGRRNWATGTPKNSDGGEGGPYYRGWDQKTGHESNVPGRFAISSLCH